MLQSVCGDEAVSRNSAFEWFKRFKDGRENLQDDPRRGCPLSSRNMDTMEKISVKWLYEILNGLSE
jgi:hypothetical protein